MPRYLPCLVALAMTSWACTRHSEIPHPDKGTEDASVAPVEQWQDVFTELPGALISVWGTGPDDVWAVGSATEGGRGALVLHYDGAQWQRHVLPLELDLWWVHGFEDGPVLMGGSSGTVLRYANGTYERELTPDEPGTVFGVWGSTPSDVWAVGGDTVSGLGSFIWRYDGAQWTSVSAPGLDRTTAFFKVWGTSAKDVWVVGTEGALLHYDGNGWTTIETDFYDPLFTVHAVTGENPRAMAVGGYDLGTVFETRDAASWSAATLPQGTRQLFGIWLTDDGAYGVGVDATVLQHRGGSWSRIETDLRTDKALHAVWVDSSGGIWAVGGDVLVPPLGAGVLVHRGGPVATTLHEIDATVLGLDIDAGMGGDPDAMMPDDAGLDGDMPDASIDPELDAGQDPGGGGDPARVACGATECDVATEACCIDRQGAEQPRCVATASACPAGFFRLQCDQTGDCNPGQQCCLYRFIQGGGINSVACGASCPGAPLCESTADCGGGSCGPSALIDNYGTCQ